MNKDPTNTLFVGRPTVHLHIADKHLLQFTASLLSGGFVSFTPAALHLLTYIKMSSSCTTMLTMMMQIAVDLLSLLLRCYGRRLWS